jgi:nucleotide-binding universal stress UspA family protein
MEVIIVGVDGSEASFNALDMAAALVRDLPDAQLVAVYCSFRPYFFPVTVEGDLDSYGIEAEAREIEDRVKTRLDGTGTAWTFERHDGRPAEELSRVAGERGARMVVVGRSGMGTMREVMVGSVSNRLIHHMDCPVLLV